MEKRVNLFTKERTMVLKGVAILFMIFHHSFRTEEFFQGFHVNFTPFAVADVVALSQLSKLCVAIFCFISGYGLYLAVCKMKQNGQSYNIWIYNRLVKLLTSYWYVYITCFTFILIFDKKEIVEDFFGDGKLYGAIQVFADAMGLGGILDISLLNGAWWYMSAAIFWIIIAPIVIKFLEYYGEIALVSIIVFLPRIFVESIDSENSIYKYLLIFIVGMIFAKNNVMNQIIQFQIWEKHGIVSKCVKLVVECIILLLLFKMAMILGHKEYWEISYTLLPLIVILITVEFIAVIPFVRGVFNFLGVYSMDIFLLHNFFRNYFQEFMYQDRYFITSSLLMLLFGVVAALAMHYLKKALGCDKLAEKLSYQQRIDTERTI